MKKTIEILLLVGGIVTGALGVPGLASAARSTPVVIDHNDVVSFESLTDDQISAAARLRSVLHHASVGNRIGATTEITGTGEPSGLEMIKQQNGAKYNRDGWRFISRSNPPWTDKINRFKTLVASEQNNYDVFGMKFCYIDFAAGWEVYRDAMEELERTYPSKIFVWWTIPIETLTTSSTQAKVDEQIMRHAFNSSLRAYAQQNNKVLFDVADIEAYKYNINTPAVITVLGSTLPYYPMYPPDPKYTSDGGHPIGEGRLILGKAFWVLMASLAGNTSGSPTPTITPTPTLVGDANGDRKVDGRDYVYWLVNFGLENTNAGISVGDFNRDKAVNGIDYVTWLINFTG